MAGQTGASPRAVELTRRAIAIVGENDPLRAGLLHESLGLDLFASGHGDTFLAAIERAVELVPAQPPSPERAQVLAALGHALTLTWRHDESLAICQEAVELAHAVGAQAAEVRALTLLGTDLAYIGRGERVSRGCGRLFSSPKRVAIPGLQRAYVYLTDVLTMLGKPGESARVGGKGSRPCAPYGTEHTALAANSIEALLAIGEWDLADTLAPRRFAGSPPTSHTWLLILRADLEIGRGVSTTRARISRRPSPPCATTPGWRPMTIRRRARAVGAPLDGRRGAVDDGMDGRMPA